MLKGFRDFILRGNIIELAIAVVIGVAFNALITSLTKDFIQPLITLIGGGTGVGAGSFTVRGVKFFWADFINAIVAFVLVAAAIYFFVVTPMNMVMARRRSGQAPPDPTTKKCPECQSEVPIAARRCAS